MFTLTKEFCFEAAHHLEGLPEEHPCSRPHGHSYRVQMVLEGEAVDTQTFFVRDYRDLDVVKKFLDGSWDHRDLNHQARFDLAPSQTTSEMLAWWLYNRFKPVLPELAAVRISETAKTWCEYRPWR